MKKIGFITCLEDKELIPYDREVVLRLKSKGIFAEGLVWDDTAVDWANYDMLVFRTCWDYYQKYNEFLQFLDKLSKLGNQIWNPIQIVKKNSHKFYLKELKNCGCEIVPTVCINKGAEVDLKLIAYENNWEEIIVKPAVAVGAFNLRRCKIETLKNPCQIASLAKVSDVLVQKYMPEIETDGEWSLVFFDGEFSHSITKFPRQGDFRIHNFYGGKYYKSSPSPEILKQAQRVARLFSDECLYIRIDGIVSNNKLFVMEVEMIEPDLYLNIVPDAMPTWIELLQRKLN